MTVRKGLKIKVDRKTVDDFLKCWNVMSDNPVDWQEICFGDYWDEGGEQRAEKVEKFIEKLSEYTGPECLYCGTSRDFCGCENL